MQEVQSRNKAGGIPPILLIFLTIFISLVGFGIVIPILPLYAQSEKFQASPAVIGWLIGSFSLAQFIFTPILGRWSDRIGRRPILLCSQIGTAISFIILGAAGSLPILFFGRILDGVTGGSISTAQAYIADISKPEDRAKSMGLIGAAFGLGFILGPAIGGALSRFGISVPFYFAAAIALVNGIFIYFFLPESLSPEKRKEQPSESIAQVTRETLSNPQLRMPILIYFILTLAFGASQSNFPLFANVRYNYTGEQIGYLLAVGGVIAAIVQGGLLGSLTRKFGDRNIALSGMLILLASCIYMVWATSLPKLLIALGAMSIGSSLTSSLLPALISKRTLPHRQGSVLGVSQSAASLARFLGPAFGGMLFGVSGPVAPFILCAVLSAITFAIAWQKLEG